MTKDAPASLTRLPSYNLPGPITKWIVTTTIGKCIDSGTVIFKFKGEDISIGKGSYVCTVEPPSLFRIIRLLLRPDVNVPSFFVNGYWNCENNKLYDFLFLLYETECFLKRYLRAISDHYVFRDNILYQLFPLYVNRRTAEHYSSNVDFMRTILGETLLYTCAFYETADDTLDQAQWNKISLTGSRLQLNSQDDVLELGSGWGNAAEMLSAQYGCRITGINITRSQVEYALSKRSSLTNFVCENYRTFDPHKTYSKIYSIGMLEHVGRGNHSAFFRKIHELLTDGGSALVHSIVREERGSTNSWIDRVIFPGGYIPRISEVTEAIENTGLRVKSIYIHDKANYFKTLSSWRAKLYDNEESLRSMLSESLSSIEIEKVIRIWDFYLSVSQLSFSSKLGKYQSVQIIIEKRQ